MTSSIFAFPAPFLSKTQKSTVSIVPLGNKTFKSWHKKQSKALQTQIKTANFTAQTGETLFLFNTKGILDKILLGVKAPVSLYDFAHALSAIQNRLDEKTIKNTPFAIEKNSLKSDDLTQACMGWGLASYRFDTYKKNDTPLPRLLWPAGTDKKRVTAFIEAICLIRSLINTPANDLGPEEMERTARTLSDTYSAKIKVTKGAALEKGYPLIHAVGKASPRAPRLIELNWGKAKDPAVTLIGKGVCFDTGGLNLKPGAYMATMKKDMGGAAHALALASLIMVLKLPLRLRVLIPAVDNDVSGGAFRPGDVLQSRKGLTVENTNTDAEGRLILADSLTAASEGKEKPDLIIDFATLTGSARAALGPDVPPFFCNNDKIAQNLQKAADQNEDPLWRMPLWQPYQDKNKSPIADLVNSAKIPGDLIYSALFLEKFLIEDQGKTPNWIHLDIFAWEPAGRPGRTQGGTDMGLRAVFAMLEKRYPS